MNRTTRVFVNLVLVLSLLVSSLPIQAVGEEFPLMDLPEDARTEVYRQIAHSSTRDERNRFTCVSKQIANEFKKVEENLALQEFKLLLLQQPVEYIEKVKIIESHLKTDFSMWLKERRAYPFFEPKLIKKSGGPKLPEMTLKEEMTFLLTELKNYLNHETDLKKFCERKKGSKYWEKMILESSVVCYARLYFIPRKFRLLRSFSICELDHPILLERDFYSETLKIIAIDFYEHEHFGIGTTVFSNLSYIRISNSKAEQAKSLGSIDPLGRTTPALEGLMIRGTKLYPRGITNLTFDEYMPNFTMLDISKTCIWDIEGWEFLDQKKLTFSHRFFVPQDERGRFNFWGSKLLKFAIYGTQSIIAIKAMYDAAYDMDYMNPLYWILPLGVLANPIYTAQKIRNGYRHFINGCAYVCSSINSGYNYVRGLFSGHAHAE